MRFKLSLLALLALGPVLPAASAAKAPPPLVEQRYGETRTSRVKTLVVMVHADAETTIAPAFAFGEAAAKALPASMALAVVRPGYADARGRTSPGARGLANGDGYTRERVGEVARTLIALRKRYRRANIILAGDGGGAALAANLIGIYPALADGLLLLSCPCALPEWRRSMAKRSPGAGFDQPVASLDPLHTIGGIPVTTRVAMLVGADDPDALPRFSRTYAEALALRGVAVDFRILPGRNGSLLADAEVTEAMKRLAASLPVKH